MPKYLSKAPEALGPAMQPLMVGMYGLYVVVQNPTSAESRFTGSTCRGKKCRWKLLKAARVARVSHEFSSRDNAVQTSDDSICIGRVSAGCALLK